jgi:DNA-binding protein YbaB
MTGKPALGDLMKKAQEMQKKMQEIQKRPALCKTRDHRPRSAERRKKHS